jgi:hypothetical protein
MKHFIAIVLLVFSVTQIFAQDRAEVTFDTLQHDFGTVKAGDLAETFFRFTNTGNVPIKIKEVRTTCSCTASDYTRESVAPGDTGFIRVNFDTEGRHGDFVKGVNVFTNAGETNLLIYVRVKGNPEEVDYENPPAPSGHDHN